MKIWHFLKCGLLSVNEIDNALKGEGGGGQRKKGKTASQNKQWKSRQERKNLAKQNLKDMKSKFRKYHSSMLKYEWTEICQDYIQDWKYEINMLDEKRKRCY